nr:MAG TPA: hypothetical protein [Caudoviricetes sp.]
MSRSSCSSLSWNGRSDECRDHRVCRPCRDCLGML